MSSEKRVKYMVLSNGDNVPIIRGDIETGYSYEPQSQSQSKQQQEGGQMPRAPSSRRRMLKKVAVFLAAFVTMQVLFHMFMPQRHHHHRHAHSDVWRQMFGPGAREGGGSHGGWWWWHGAGCGDGDGDGDGDGTPEPPHPPHHGHPRPRPPHHEHPHHGHHDHEHEHGHGHGHGHGHEHPYPPPPPPYHHGHGHEHPFPPPPPPPHHGHGHGHGHEHPHPPPPPPHRGHGHERPYPPPPPPPPPPADWHGYDEFSGYGRRPHAHGNKHGNKHGDSHGSDGSKGDPVPKPFRHGAAKWRGAFSRINTEAVALLNKGDLAISGIGSLFHTSPEDMCIPAIAVPDLDSFTFDPVELSKISSYVVGVVGADIRIEASDDKDASYTAHVMVSSNKIAEEISLTQTKGEDGSVAFRLQGPKWLPKGECAYASIVVKIPKTTKEIASLYTSYVYGNFKVDRTLARQVTFGEFGVNAAVSSINTPPLRAADVSINTVSGGIHGHYIVSNGVSIHSVNGKIDAGINVHNAERSNIVTESVSGSVALRIVGGFDGSFTARTINGAVEVEDMSDGTSRLHFDKNLSRVKTGTFGPADSTRAGDSSLKAVVVNGKISIEFD